MRRWILPLLAVGCGHGGLPASERVPAPTPVPAATTPAYHAVARMQHDYRLGHGCGSGPFLITLDVPRLPGVTRVRLLSVGKHPLPLRFDGVGNFTTFIHPREPDERCHVRAGEKPASNVKPALLARRAAPTPEPVPAAAFGPTARPAELVAADVVPTKEETWLQWQMYLTDGKLREIPELEGQGCWSLVPTPDQPFHLRLWLTAVQYLDDSALRLVVDEIQPTGSTQEFERRVAERITHDRTLAATRAQACQEKPDDWTCTVGCSRAAPRTGQALWVSPGPLPAPPAEKPSPRPHPDAQWIAGSWHWTGAKYEWDRGFWRTAADVVAAPDAPTATVNVAFPSPAHSPPPQPAIAPSLPPALRLETPPPPTGPAVRWVPGYWIWARAMWTWVPGGWRIPPMPAARFVPPRIDAVPGGFYIAPGGWMVAPR